MFTDLYVFDYERAYSSKNVQIGKQKRQTSSSCQEFCQRLLFSFLCMKPFFKLRKYSVSNLVVTNTKFFLKANPFLLCIPSTVLTINIISYVNMHMQQCSIPFEVLMRKSIENLRKENCVCALERLDLKHCNNSKPKCIACVKGIKYYVNTYVY